MNQRTREIITAIVFAVLLVGLLWVANSFKAAEKICFVDTAEQFDKMTAEVIDKSVKEAIEKAAIKCGKSQCTCECCENAKKKAADEAAAAKKKAADEAAAAKKKAADEAAAAKKKAADEAAAAAKKKTDCEKAKGTWAEGTCTPYKAPESSPKPAPVMAPPAPEARVDFCGPDSKTVIIHTDDKAQLETRISSRAPAELEDLDAQTRVGFACVHSQRKDFFDVKVKGAGWFAKDGYQEVKIFLRLEENHEAGQSVPYREIEVTPDMVVDHNFDVSGFGKAIEIPLDKLESSELKSAPESLLYSE